MTHTFRIAALITLGSACCFINSQGFAAIDQVRIINNTNTAIDIHIGGYAVSQSIAPGSWKVLHYPFTVVPPGGTTPVQTTLLVASAGGQWQTTPNGMTSLMKPTMLLCIDYNSPDLASKTGNRKWVIKSTGGFDKGCVVKSYKQPWYQG